MTHPRQDQVEDLAQALERHPNQRFLIHGLVPRADLADLLRNHTNMHLTIDARGMLCDWDTAGHGNTDCLWPDLPGWERFAAESDKFLAEAVEDYGPIIAAAPDRVMWGTDVATLRAAESADYDAIVELSRRFIAALPAEQQDAYASQNALRLFGPGEPVPPMTWKEDIPSLGFAASIIFVLLIGVRAHKARQF